MNILHVTPTYYPATYWGGPIFSVYALNSALSQLQGVSLKVLTTDSAGPQVSDRLNSEELDDLYPNQHVVFARRIAGVSVSLELLMKLPGLVRRADVVHLTASYSFPIIPTLLVCRMLRKPVVWSPRGAILDAHEWGESRKRLLKRLWERLCNVLIRPGMVVTHTTSVREQEVTQASLPKANAIIVPNGVNVPEVMMVRDGRSIPAFLSDFGDVPGVALQWFYFGSSGHQQRPQERVIRAYTRRATEPNHHFKVFVRPEQVTRNRNPHNFYYRRARCAVREDGRRVYGSMARPPSVERAWINHYYCKSLEDYLEKASRPSTHDRSGIKNPSRQTARVQEAMAAANEVIDTCAIAYYEARCRRLEEGLPVEAAS